MASDVAALIFTNKGSNQQNVSTSHCPFMCFRLDTRKIISYNKTWNFQPLSYMISMAHGVCSLISHLIFLLCQVLLLCCFQLAFYNRIIVIICITYILRVFHKWMTIVVKAIMNITMKMKLWCVGTSCETLQHWEK